MSTITPTTPMVYKIDWLQFTEEGEDDDILTLTDSVALAFFKAIGYDFKQFEEVPGRYFYECGLTLGRFFTIYFNNSKNIYTKNTIYFVFTGQGSSDLALKLAKYFKTDDFSLVWYKFFKLVKEWQLKVTRLDAALDDFEGRLSFAKMERKLSRREFRSSKRRYKIIHGKSTDGETKGETIYLGSRKKHQHGFLVRFYDKFAEYKDKGAVVPAVVENVITGAGTHVWQRYEIEIRGDACKNFIEKILGGYSFGQLYKGLMRNAIEFLKVDRSNKNRAFWPVVDWWEEFLESTEKCSLTSPERDLDLGRLLRWIRVAVVPSLHLLQEIGTEKNFDIYELIKSIEVISYAKKQERLRNDVLNMSEDKVKEYIKQFEKGNY